MPQRVERGGPARFVADGEPHHHNAVPPVTSHHGRRRPLRSTRHPTTTVRRERRAAHAHHGWLGVTRSASCGHDMRECLVKFAADSEPHLHHHNAMPHPRRHTTNDTNHPAQPDTRRPRSVASGRPRTRTTAGWGVKRSASGGRDVRECLVKVADFACVDRFCGVRCHAIGRPPWLTSSRSVAGIPVGWGTTT